MTKAMFNGILMPLALTMVCIFISQSTGCQDKDPLLFPKDRFTVESRIVKTSSGEMNITYRSYMHIPYVTNPVDKDYQSLNVSVPIKVDDTNTCFNII